MNVAKKGLGKGLNALIPGRKEEETRENGVNEIPVALITTNPWQPRQEFNQARLEELAKSIEKSGLIQPIIVRKTGDGYQLIAGERRLRAYRYLGKETIPAIIRAIDDGQVLELALLENIQREELNCLEEAEAIRRLQEEFNYTQEMLSQRLGRSRSAIANTLRLLQLSEPVRKALRDEQITAGHGRALLALNSEQDQNLALKLVIEKGLSVRQTEELVKNWPRQQKSEQTREKKEKKVAAVLVDIEEVLKRKLGTGVKVKGKENKGKIEIAYYSEEELQRIIELIAGEECFT
ncbi:chromosome partitioning protein, ParB family [Carboxydocella sporoproducens DSM 16521]|uniref:Chromosome partitioning protein, ParB family n=2 Tax=Carboxydocella TaxID=178898 RepID=A0A1T4RQZ6_9FIRM|nr:chromosome segregation DNA-binding protein [Carboxydocella thermautotrophica]SKA18188.1 chromosome partitioning protein, ParB family [Carboxydocella sporoproducens DSM 16521]